MKHKPCPRCGDDKVVARDDNAYSSSYGYFFDFFCPFCRMVFPFNALSPMPRWIMWDRHRDIIQDRLLEKDDGDVFMWHVIRAWVQEKNI